MLLNFDLPITQDNKPTGDDFLEEATCWKQIRSKFKMFDYNHHRIPAEPSFFMASFSRGNFYELLLKCRQTTATDIVYRTVCPSI